MIAEPRWPPLSVHDKADPFTHDSVYKRLPNILREVPKYNPSLPEHVRADVLKLADEIAADAPIRALAAGPQEPTWREWAEANAGKRPSELAWWPLEVYAYKLLLDSLRYVETRADPFSAQKADALSHAGAAFRDTALPLAAGPASDLKAALLRSLWGNRADLSLTGGQVHAHTVAEASPSAAADAEEEGALLLADDSAAVLTLLQQRGGEVIIVLDNCGLELLTDLVLADVLLSLSSSDGAARVVTLLCKTAPIFVSDAMEKDVHAHIEYIAAGCGVEDGTGVPPACTALADRLRAAVSSGRLRVESHAFYTSLLPAWHMPHDLQARFKSATLAICKGDANYRRLLGDLHWPHTTPFAEAVPYFPCPLLALRTCKAGLIVGISPAAEARAVAANPADWLVSGRYGVVQLKQ